MAILGRLMVAVSPTRRVRLEDICAERTAGAWIKHVQFHDLLDDGARKGANDGTVAHLAQGKDVQVLAASNLTSKSIERKFSNVKLLNRWKIEFEVEQWLETNQLTWRSRVKTYCQTGPYLSLTPDAWCQQFHRVDPKLGVRVGAAILAQFKMLGASEFAGWFDCLPKVDAYTYFVGADPHSGDHGLITSLAARISGLALLDAKRLPKLAKQARVRLFSDAGWSGGESKRRLECLYTPCSHKSHALCNTNYVHLRFGFLTDAAQLVLTSHLSKLVERGLVCHPDRVTVSYPIDNFLKIKGEHGIQKGLAFQDQLYLDYVDKNNPNAIRELCKLIGQQIAPGQPLGTNEIASTIAFQHSLPKAMLPVLIGGGLVTAHDGSTFEWKPLLRSKHITEPASDVDGYHCSTCPLDDRQ